MDLLCPVCAAKLELSDNADRLFCPLNHSFDRARQGYWNLLLPQQKRSKTPGDSSEMVAARQRFLTAGYYEPLRDLICAEVLSLVRKGDELLDLGAGEGYYTDAIQRQIQKQGNTAAVTGVDISKPAIRVAARRNTAIEWLIASAAHLPLASQSVDIATVIFSRTFGQELARVLKPGGAVLIVYPGLNHLRSVRSLIYDQVINKPYDPIRSLGNGFEPLKTASLQTNIQLEDSQALSDLLLMTPHGQRINAQRREAFLNHSALEIEVDVELALFRALGTV